MVFNIANGIGAPLFTPESLNSIYLNKKLKPYDKDINKSKELLKNQVFIRIKKENFMINMVIEWSLTYIQMPEILSERQSVLWSSKILKIWG